MKNAMNKNLILISLLVIIGTIGTSCKKKIYGCMDSTALNYSPVATEDGQDCVYEAKSEILVSNTINNITWVNEGTYWSSSITWSEITTYVINNGAVSAFIGDGGEWTQLSYTIFWGGYQTHVIAIYSVGKVDLIWEDSDGVLPETPFLNKIKLVIYQ